MFKAERHLVAVTGGWCMLAFLAVAVAGIPEPDVVLYGQLYLDGVLQHATDDVELIARVDGVADPVGTFQMGDVAATVFRRRRPRHPAPAHERAASRAEDGGANDRGEGRGPVGREDLWAGDL